MKKLFLFLCLLGLVGCDGGVMNNPYPALDEGKSILYSAFGERPKHLDPAQAYSENEYVFLAQIYAPPLQYHYLKRPYELIPLAAQALPRVHYLDKHRQPLPDTAPVADIAFSVYDIEIKANMRYQPHPALARNAAGQLRYHALTAEDLRGVHTLTDFAESGTRVVTAADYVHQIKRLAHPQLHTPILGVMGEYIVGMKEFAHTLQTAVKKQPKTFLEVASYPLAGAQVVDDTHYRVEILGKYPQFAYWLAMPLWFSAFTCA